MLNERLVSLLKHWIVRSSAVLTLHRFRKMSLRLLRMVGGILDCRSLMYSPLRSRYLDVVHVSDTRPTTGGAFRAHV